MSLLYCKDAYCWTGLSSNCYITYCAGGCETKFNRVVVAKKDRNHVRNVQVSPREMQHTLMIVDKKMLK